MKNPKSKSVVMKFRFTSEDDHFCPSETFVVKAESVDAAWEIAIEQADKLADQGWKVWEYDLRLISSWT